MGQFAYSTKKNDVVGFTNVKNLKLCFPTTQGQGDNAVTIYRRPRRKFIFIGRSGVQSRQVEEMA